MKYCFVLLITLLSLNLHSIEISSMFELMKNEKANFTVTNTAQHRIYLHVGMSELQVEKGEIVKTAYTRHNLDNWQISVRPAKTIIEPGFQKKIEVTYQCKVDCNSQKDKLFQLAVVPTPYFPEGKPNKNAVQMAVGFAPIVAMVNQEQAPKYQIKHLGDSVAFINQGESLFSAVMDSCEDKSKCRAQAKVLAGRNLVFKLPTEMQNKQLTLTLSSAFDKYEQVVILKRNGVLTK